MNKIKLSLLAVLATAFASGPMYAVDAPALSSVKITNMARTLDVDGVIKAANTTVYVQVTTTYTPTVGSPIVYVETFTTTTNAFGQFTVSIGGGTEQNEPNIDFTTLKLNNDTKVEVAINYTGLGNDFTKIAEKKYLDIVKDMPASMDGVAKTDADNTFVGNQTIFGTLGVSGLTSLNGGIAVDTDNFTVDGTTGAVTTQSSLTVDGDNPTTLGGTLGVTGALTGSTGSFTGNVAANSFTQNSNAVLDASSIGVTVQGYDANTTKLGSDIDLSTAEVTGILPAAKGGTGVDNTGKTITLGGNLTTTGAFATTLTATATTEVTLPTSGTLATLAGTETLTNKTLTSPKINEDVAVTATATELNLLDGVTATTAELNILDGVAADFNEINALDGATAGTVVASKAVVVDDNKDITGFRNVGIGGTLGVTGALTGSTGSFSGNVAANSFTQNSNAVLDASSIGVSVQGYDANTTKLGSDIDLSTAEVTGILSAAKGGTGVDNTGKTITLGGNLTTTGAFATTLTATATTEVTLPTSGTLATLAGTETLTNKTLTSPKINEDVAVTATATELNLLDGVTATTAELNILDGVAADFNEINALDGATAGTVVASKAVVVDDNKDITGFRNVGIGGTLGVTGATTLDGNLAANGSITLGNASSDAVTVNARISSGLVPSVNTTFDLGSSALRWTSLFVGENSINIGTDANNAVISYDADFSRLGINKDVTIGDATDFSNASGDNDLYVKGNLEVDGAIYGSFSGSISGNATTATTATNLASGAAGSLVYQSAAGTSAFLAIGTANKILTSNGAEPQWSSSIADAQIDNNLTISGGTIENTVIGATTPVAGTFSSLTASSFTVPNDAITNAMVANDLTISGGTVNNTVIGGVTAAAGTFTTLSASSITLTTDLTNDQVDDDLTIVAGLIDNTPIGSTTASSGKFTTLAASGVITVGSGITNYVLPTARGTNNQVLKTDASGNVTWQSLDASISLTNANTWTNTQTINVSGSGLENVGGLVVNRKGTSEAIAATGDVKIISGNLTMTSGNISMAAGTINVNNEAANNAAAMKIVQNYPSYAMWLKNTDDEGTSVIETNAPLAYIQNNADELTELNKSARGLVVYNSNSDNASEAIYALHAGTGSALKAESPAGLAIEIPDGGGAVKFSYGIPMDYTDPEAPVARTDGGAYTIPSNVSVVNLDEATAAWDLTMPDATVAGKLLIIINNDNDPTTGSVITAGDKAIFVSNGTIWIRIN